MKFRKIAFLSLGLLVSLTSCDLDFVNSNSSTSTPSNSSTSDLSSSSSSNQDSSSSSSSINVDPNATKLLVPEQQDAYKIPGSERIIYENEDYVAKEDVAAYLIAFKKMPDNYYYKDYSNVCIREYPETCMLYGSYSFGNREGLLPRGYDYIELDLYFNDSSYSETHNRNTIRLVATLGNTDPADDAVYYTSTHYSSYSEYLNYYEGWSETWNKAANHPDQVVAEYIEVDGQVLFVEPVNSADLTLTLPVFKYEY